MVTQQYDVQSSYWKSCKHSVQEVFQVGKLTVHIGPQVYCQHKTFDLIVSCNGIRPDQTPTVIRSETSLEMPQPLPEDLFQQVTSPWMVIRWTDQGVPALTKAWWVTFAEYLRTFEGSVCFYCVGGHGRSGTAVSILAALLGVVEDDADPVAFLRDKYCDEVVESLSQLHYVEEITGHKVSEQIPGFQNTPPISAKAPSILPTALLKQNDENVDAHKALMYEAIIDKTGKIEDWIRCGVPASGVGTDSARGA